ncbi:potassium/proton antiporter [Nocardioides caldifontis]|uniref:potassium/proton antiporter n=1 Tax=Nocardioides caldifontis TaxID=2588938 RepID=UPI0011E05AF9|nr:potassium/proton antiporter [Nocardioides caldifontis]
MTPADLNVVLLVGTGVLLIGVGAVRVSTGLGLPSLLLYLAIGLAIGEAGLGVDFTDADLTATLGSLALGVILAEGGLTTDWKVVRPVSRLALVLASLGVLVSVAVTTSLAYLLLDVDLRTAVLLGAVVSSTDAAAVFAVLRQMRILPRTRAVLEAESGFNDPPVIILVTLVVSDQWDSLNAGTVALGFLQQLVIGAVIGVLVAKVGRWVLTRTALPSTGLYPLSTMAFALLAYGIAGVAGGSPFLAVYVAALVLGNADLPHRTATRGFAEGLAWMAQIGLFVLLGLLAAPERLVDALVPALVVGVALTFVARPLSVVICSAPFRVPWREQAFMSWAGLRGAVPIVLATMPMSAGLDGAQRVFDVVFLLVVVFTLVQGPTLPWFADRTGVGAPSHTKELAIEFAPFEELKATMLSLDVPPGSRLAGVHVSELRLPGDAVLSLVMRDKVLFVPGPGTQLRTGDHLLIAAGDTHRAAAEERLREISRGGRLARWHAEDTARPSGPGAGTASERRGRTRPPGEEHRTGRPGEDAPHGSRATDPRRDALV